MRENIHPAYRTVVFHDTSADEYFRVGSTIKTDRTIELEGATYPYISIDSVFSFSSLLHRQAERVFQRRQHRAL